MTGCHQFVPMLEPGAVGQHTLEVQRALRNAGVSSEIFTEFLHPSMEGRARLYGEYGTPAWPARPDDTLLYQFAIGSVVASFLRSRSERKGLHHHNLTPPELLAGWEPQVVPGLRWGRRQLVELASSVDFALAVSSFNRADLRDSGFRDVEIVPILLDVDAFDREVDTVKLGRLETEKAAGGADLLFVGRIAPNKCQHDLVKALAAYRRSVDPRARLRLVGGSSSERYLEAVRAFAHAAGVGDAVDLAGSVSAGELSAYYRTADAFVSASEHEGFCVPLLEAMHHRVPIVAFAAAAVPETLGDAGILVTSKAPADFAAAVAVVLHDAELCRRLAAAGTRRLGDFALARTRRRLLDVLTSRGVGMPS